MNNWFKSLFGVSGAAFLVLMATNGKELVAAFEAAFLFLDKLAETAPLGLGSFALASALAVVIQAFVHRYAASLPCPRSQDFALALVALVVGTGVMYLQLRTLNGLLLGLLAGFSAPFLYQGVAAAWGALIRSTTKETVDE